MKSRPALATWTIVLSAGLVWVTPAPALAQEPVVVAGPQAKYYTYLTPVTAVQKGGSLRLANLDLERHDLVQDVDEDGVHGSSKKRWCRLFPKGRCPIFWSKLIGLGQTTAVKGLSAIRPGKVYTFFCSIHPGMKGRLVAL